eukprot:1328717-Amphidinium_carterae.1
MYRVQSAPKFRNKPRPPQVKRSTSRVRTTPDGPETAGRDDLPPPAEMPIVYGGQGSSTGRPSSVARRSRSAR